MPPKFQRSPPHYSWGSPQRRTKKQKNQSGKRRIKQKETAMPPQCNCKVTRVHKAAQQQWQTIEKDAAAKAGGRTAISRLRDMATKNPVYTRKANCAAPGQDGSCNGSIWASKPKKILFICGDLRPGECLSTGFKFFRVSARCSKINSTVGLRPSEAQVNAQPKSREPAS